MMNKEYQRFTNWMEKHQNKIIYGMMYDGKIYRWNSYIPEDATKNYLLDMKRCLLDGVKLIDDVYKLDRCVRGDVEKDTTNFMESKGVESRSAQGGGKLMKYFMATAHYISDEQKKQNSKYIRDILKNTLQNEESIDRVDDFDIISGLYWFLFEMIMDYEGDFDFLVLQHEGGVEEEMKLLDALEHHNYDIDKMMDKYNLTHDVDYLLKLKEKMKKDKTILDNIKIAHTNLKQSKDDVMFA